MRRFVILIPLGILLAVGCSDDKATVINSVEIPAQTPQNEKTLTGNLWRTADDINQIRVLQLDSTIKGWQALNFEKSNCHCILYLTLNRTQGIIDYRDRDNGKACQLLPKFEIMQVPVDEVKSCKEQPLFNSFTFTAGVLTLYNPMNNIDQVFY